MRDKNIYGKILVNLIISILITVICITVVPRLLSIFFPFVVAYIISIIANPLVRFLERRVKILRKHSSAIIIIVVIATIFVGIYFLGVFLIKQISLLVEDIPNIAKSVAETMDYISVRFSKVYILMPEGIQDFIRNLNENAEIYFTNFLNELEPPSIPDISNYVKNFANFIFKSIITVLATYFFIADRDRMAEVSNRIFPESIRKGYKLVVDNFKDAVGGYFRAQFKIMLILLLVMFLAFEMMDVSFSFLLALGIAILDFLPIFGTGAVFGPWAIVDLVSGRYLKAVFIIILYLVCLLIKQLLQPKMVGDSIGISPLTTLLFMFIGWHFKGVIGIIFAIPIGMLVVNFYRIGMFDRIIKGFKILIKDINDYRKY